MKNAVKYYSVGALLYCPANRAGIAESIINQKFGDKFSLALCLEDTIGDDCVSCLLQDSMASTVSFVHFRICRHAHSS